VYCVHDFEKMWISRIIDREGIMDLFDAINGRHSYRGGYTGDLVSTDDLRKIVQAGIQAPSGCNAQTTSFVIVTERDQVKEMASVLGKDFATDAGAMIVCIVDHRDVYHGMSFGVEDCSAAVENMLLAIEALGYATVWLDGCIRQEDRERKIAEMLGVPEGQEVRVILPVGVAEKKWKQMEKLPFSERAFFEQYGQVE
jgi:nitroreductase